MAVQYHLYQIEAKAAAAGGAVPGALLPVERLIQMGQSVLPDMRFCVFHRHSWTPVLPAAPDTDPGPIRRIEGGVGDQVPQHLSQQNCIPDCGDPRRQFLVQMLAPLLQKPGVQLQLLLKQGGKLHRLLFHRCGSGLHPGDGQHLLNQVLHAPRHLKRAKQILVPVLINSYALQHSGQLSLQDGDRGL